jgi:large subunit ribosomal protein L35
LLKEEAQTLRTSITELEKSPDRDDTELDAMRERLEILDVQSEVNLPSVRWKCANGLGMRDIFS